jgi:chromosome segregation ATPase
MTEDLKQRIAELEGHKKELMREMGNWREAAEKHWSRIMELEAHCKTVSDRHSFERMQDAQRIAELEKTNEGLAKLLDEDERDQRIAELEAEKQALARELAQSYEDVEERDQRIAELEEEK